MLLSSLCQNTSLQKHAATVSPFCMRSVVQLLHQTVHAAMTPALLLAGAYVPVDVPVCCKHRRAHRPSYSAPAVPRHGSGWPAAEEQSERGVAQGQHVVLHELCDGPTTMLPSNQATQPPCSCFSCSDTLGWRHTPDVRVWQVSLTDDIGAIRSAFRELENQTQKRASDKS